MHNRATEREELRDIRKRDTVGETLERRERERERERSERVDILKRGN